MPYIILEAAASIDGKVEALRSKKFPNPKSLSTKNEVESTTRCLTIPNDGYFIEL